MQLDPEWSRCLYLPITRWMLLESVQMSSGNVEFALLLSDAPTSHWKTMHANQIAFNLTHHWCKYRSSGTS